MQIKPRDVLFVGIVVVVVGGLYFLSTRQRIPVLAAQPVEHQTAKAREDCLKCHVPEKMGALESIRKHPLKWRDARVSCLQCHKAPPAQTTQVFPEFTAPNLQSQISNLNSSNVWQKQQ
ncbi:MAG: hypothetical protein U0Y68_08030 [Blastocatellia bacterium]